MNVSRAVAAGLVATASMTALLLIEPAIGLPEIAIGQLLSSSLSIATAHSSIGPAMGWLIHFAIGVAWALVYVGLFLRGRPGSPVGRGLAFGFLVFLLAQTVFMPLVGAGLFSRGSPSLLAGSLLGHLVYGSVLGWGYGAAGSADAVLAPRTA